MGLMGWLKRAWEWLPRITIQKKPLSPGSPSILRRRAAEAAAMLKAGCWLDRASYDARGLHVPLTVVKIHRRQEDGLLIPDFISLIAWTGENVEGEIVYEVIDEHVEAGSSTIRVPHNGGLHTIRTPRYVRIGCWHSFSFTNPDSAFAFKMRWA
jgi:hypothetical protein